MKKITEQPIEKVLIITFLLIAIGFAIYLKILGSTDIPILVEKDGYCKLKYGEKSNFNEVNEYCSFEGKKLSLDESDFRKLCPKNNLFSTKLYSDCFYLGDPRN